MEMVIDELWTALASPVRRQILDLLRDGPRTTTSLTEEFSGLSRFAIMQHLDVLEACGLVLVRREGRQRFNYLNAVPLQQMHERWVSKFAAQSASGMLALQRFVEKPKGDNMEEAGRIIKIEQQQRLNAPIEKVFAALTVEMDEWWGMRFKDESKIVVEPWVGGRIFEDWGGGQGALYGNIVYFEPPYRVCSRGPGGINGNFSNMNWETLERDGDATIRKVSLRIWGEVPPEMEKMFTEGSKAIAEQMLRNYVEHGKSWRES
jgi:DNA-binding transcriptional ArsR family regulator/uncharacterized protein YndB with AHSA1/START domain